MWGEGGASSQDTDDAKVGTRSVGATVQELMEAVTVA